MKAQQQQITKEPLFGIISFPFSQLFSAFLGPTRPQPQLLQAWPNNPAHSIGELRNTHLNLPLSVLKPCQRRVYSWAGALYKMTARMSNWAGASESGVYAPDMFRGLIPPASPSRKMDRVSDLLQKRSAIMDARAPAQFVIQQTVLSLPGQKHQHHGTSPVQSFPKVSSTRPASAQSIKPTAEKIIYEDQNDLLTRTVDRLNTTLPSELSLADLAMELSRLDILIAPILLNLESSTPKASTAISLIWQRMCSISRISLESHFKKFETITYDFQHSEVQNKQMKKELMAATEELRATRSKEREILSQMEKYRVESKRARGEVERLRAILFAKGDVAAEEITFLKLAHQQIMNEVGVEDFEQEKLLDEIGNLQTQIKAEVAHEREEFSKVIDAKAALRLDAEVSRRFKAYVRQKEGELPSADFLNMKTPRPLWSKLLNQNCGHVTVPGESSHDKVAYLTALIGRLVPKPLPPKEKRQLQSDTLMNFSQALGTGADVPQWLKWGGKVNLRGVTKIETEKLVREVWTSKKQDDKAMQQREKPLKKVIDFMPLWLMKKVGNFSHLMADLAYNFMDGLQRYQEDADIELFFKIVTKRLDEAVYYDQTAFLQKVFIDMQTLDYKENGGKLLGFIPIPKFNLHLSATFKFKSASRVNAIIKSSKEPHPAGNAVDDGGIRYEILFSEDREMNQGPFAECLRDQYLQERQEWIDEIDLKLQSLAAASSDTSIVSKAQVVEGIKFVDKGKSKKDIDEILTIGFALADVTAVAKLKNDGTVKIDIFIGRISKMVIRWTAVSQRAMEEDANERMQAALLDTQKLVKEQKHAAKASNSNSTNAAGEDAEDDIVLTQENYHDATKMVKKR